ncbi:MAG: hypothetical protein IJQ02_06815 [Oscillospiraceae bacterium]|nr:hypothetical protein [Oscillospiraceae bacterium]
MSIGHRFLAFVIHAFPAISYASLIIAQTGRNRKEMGEKAKEKGIRQIVQKCKKAIVSFSQKRK